MNGYPLKFAAIKRSRTMRVLPEDSELDDNELVALSLGGRIDSFRQLVGRYRNRAVAYARAIVGNTEDAHDISQEAFIRVHRHLKRFDPGYSFKTWFFHILSNLCRNHLRNRTVRARTSSMDAVGPIEAPANDRPDIAYRRMELQKAIREAIDDLPPDFREIIMLSHFQDMSYEQIATVLEIPRGSVMSRLYYARRKLRGILEKRGVSL